MIYVVVVMFVKKFYQINDVEGSRSIEGVDTGGEELEVSVFCFLLIRNVLDSLALLTLQVGGDPFLPVLVETLQNFDALSFGRYCVVD
jgi:hypothetical protein